MRKLEATLIASLVVCAQSAIAQSNKSTAPDLTGIYEIVPNNVTIPGGLKNSGSPEELSLQPAAAAKAKATDLTQDPAKTCQFIGPFRMMAREGSMIDVLPSLKQNRIFILFEDYFTGFFREVFLDRPPQGRNFPIAIRDKGTRSGSGKPTRWSLIRSTSTSMFG